MVKHIVLAIALTLALPAIGKQSGHHGGSVSGGKGATVTREGSVSQHVHGGSHAARDLRRPPALDPARKVNAQDCTKPLDLESGNVKCK